MKNKKSILSFSLLSLALFAVLIISGSLRQSAAAGALDVFPSNSRLSFRGLLADGNTADTSVAIIKTVNEASGAAYSTTSAQLINGDQVNIGTHSYTVGVTSANLPASQLPLTTRLDAADIAEDTIVYAPMSGSIKLTYTPTDAITDGSFTFLFPAKTNTTESGDGVPDSGGFDFNTASITCPTPDANYTAWTSSAAPSFAGGVAIGLSYFHAFTCSYTGNSTTAPLSFTINNLINSAPMEYIPEYQVGRTIGAMDILNVRAGQFDNALDEVSNANNYVGFGTSVKMTVKVLPQLTFVLSGIAEGASVCNGLQANVTTTGVTVPFGSISNTNFLDAAQKMRITTNAANGYVVTAIANDQMGVSGQACTGIGDTADCIPGYGSTTVAAPWTVADGRGFGYTLNVVSGDDYLNSGTPNVHTTFGVTDGWRSFADRADGNQPIQIINNLQSTNGDEVDVCYRIMSSANNIPGEYRSTLTYTVTASF